MSNRDLKHRASSIDREMLTELCAWNLFLPTERMPTTGQRRVFTSVRDTTLVSTRQVPTLRQHSPYITISSALAPGGGDLGLVDTGERRLQGRLSWVIKVWNVYVSDQDSAKCDAVGGI